MGCLPELKRPINLVLKSDIPSPRMTAGSAIKLILPGALVLRCHLRCQIYPPSITIIIIIIIIVIIIIIIIIIIFELPQSKAILENTVEIEPQPVVALDFKNLSQYSSHYK